ncbi:MAG: hypothetical protein ABI193_21085 [Minicystis sp.]
MLRRALILAVLGAVFGTLFDYAHVRTGAIVYPASSPIGVPFWVPFLYAGSALLIGFSHPSMDRRLGRPERFAPTPQRLVAGFAGFLGVWFLSGALPFGSGVVALILAPIALGIWFFLDRTWQGLLLGMLTAIIGFAMEVVLSRAGLFRHTHPDVLGIAVWLPCIYVAASVGVGNLGRALAPRR